MLMDSHITGYHCIASNVDMASQQRPTYESHFVFKMTVMSNVGIGHQVTAIADFRSRQFNAGTMNCHRLPYHATLADPTETEFPVVFLILGLISNNRVRMNRTVSSNFRMPHNDNGGAQLAVGTDADWTIDHSIRTNFT